MDALWIRIFVVLLLSHLLGDFTLQFNVIAQNKKKWYWLVLHSAINSAMAFLLLAAWKLWRVPLVVGISHFLIDLFKMRLKKSRTFIFILDQLAHIAVLTILATYAISRGIALPFWMNWYPELVWPIIVIVAAIILLLPCGGYLIGLFVRPYQVNSPLITKLSEKYKSRDWQMVVG